MVFSKAALRAARLRRALPRYARRCRGAARHDRATRSRPAGGSLATLDGRLGDGRPSWGNIGPREPLTLGTLGPSLTITNPIGQRGCVTAWRDAPTSTLTTLVRRQPYESDLSD